MRLGLAGIYSMVLLVVGCTIACAVTGDSTAATMGVVATVGWGGWSVTATAAYMLADE